jgi:hypothetical protein
VQLPSSLQPLLLKLSSLASLLLVLKCRQQQLYTIVSALQFVCIVCLADKQNKLLKTQNTALQNCKIDVLSARCCAMLFSMSLLC